MLLSYTEKTSTAGTIKNLESSGVVTVKQIKDLNSHSYNYVVFVKNLSWPQRKFESESKRLS